MLFWDRLSKQFLEIPSSEKESYTYQAYQHWYLNQWADNSGKGLPRANAKDGHSYSDGQFKVVTGRGK